MNQNIIDLLGFYRCFQNFNSWFMNEFLKQVDTILSDFVSTRKKKLMLEIMSLRMMEQR